MSKNEAAIEILGVAIFEMEKAIEACKLKMAALRYEEGLKREGVKVDNHKAG